MLWVAQGAFRRPTDATTPPATPLAPVARPMLPLRFNPRPPDAATRMRRAVGPLVHLLVERARGLSAGDPHRRDLLKLVDQLRRADRGWPSSTKSA